MTSQLTAFIPMQGSDGASAYLLRKARLTTIEVSTYLMEQHAVKLSPSTLEKMRCRGGGPMFQRFGRAVLYRRTDLDAWINDGLTRPVASTSEL